MMPVWHILDLEVIFVSSVSDQAIAHSRFAAEMTDASLGQELVTETPLAPGEGKTSSAVQLLTHSCRMRETLKGGHRER